MFISNGYGLKNAKFEARFTLYGSPVSENPDLKPLAGLAAQVRGFYLDLPRRRRNSVNS